uniref:Exostosin GT47 domain-containing protein n=1 Tax=Dunaliella tertiolecta TaxID=3047 RepID=A0A7S3QU18_DUNTE|mmetsp:Transcript_26754/g.72287  ORF Transcript_26754/g.72287 Transcript_26754/m.72287 type:complete len:421 (-) Transcript_26754:1163-2425(-)|eukprot:423232-Pelagomonas_calceolata.AAC.2
MLTPAQVNPWDGVTLLLSLSIIKSRLIGAWAPNVYVFNKVPQYSIELLDCCKSLSTFSNYGLGPVEKDLHARVSGGSFHTNQFALDVILYFKFLNYSRRVAGPEEAHFVFLPLFFSLIQKSKKHCPHCSRGIAASTSAATQTKFLEECLSHDEIVRKRVIISLARTPPNYLDGLLAGKFYNFTRNWIFFGIEKPEIQLPLTVVMVPYPTIFHFSADKVSIQLSPRPVFVSFGSPRLGMDPVKSSPRSPDTMRLRNTLMSMLFASRTSLNISVLTKSNFTISRLYSIMKVSTFCIQPPGDTRTRRGFYDALLLGCIPVLFNSKHRSADYDLRGFDLSRASIQVPEEAIVGGGGSIFKVLQEISRSEILSMQTYIAKHRSFLQYSSYQDERLDAFSMILDTLETETTFCEHCLRNDTPGNLI